MCCLFVLLVSLGFTDFLLKLNGLQGNFFFNVFVFCLINCHGYFLFSFALRKYEGFVILFISFELGFYNGFVILFSDLIFINRN